MYNVLLITCFNYSCAELYILLIILLHLPFIYVCSAQKAFQERYISVKDNPRTTFYGAGFEKKKKEKKKLLLLTFLDKAATIYLFQTFIPRWAWGDPIKGYVVFLVKGLLSNVICQKSLWLDGWNCSGKINSVWRGLHRLEGLFPLRLAPEGFQPCGVPSILKLAQGHNKSWIQIIISFHLMEKFIISTWIWH